MQTASSNPSSSRLQNDCTWQEFDLALFFWGVESSGNGMRNFTAYHWYYAGKAWIVCSKGALLAKSRKLVWSSGGGKFTGCTSRFGNIRPTSLITKRTSLGCIFVSCVVQIVTLMFNDTRGLKVEAAMPRRAFPDSQNLERKTRCKTAMLVFIFGVKLSYLPHPALLYITCHILLVWLSVARAVMMWGGKRNCELWHLSRRTVWNLIEIVPCRWREYIYFCRISRSSEKRSYKRNTCSAVVEDNKIDRNKDEISFSTWEMA